MPPPTTTAPGWVGIASRGVGRGRNAVPEVKDVTGSGPSRLENISNSLFDNGPRGLQQRGVQIPLHGLAGHLSDGPRQVRLPVDAHAVGPDLGHVGQDRSAARAEVDERGALARHRADGTRDALCNHARVRRNGLSIGARREGAHPRVEELRGAGTRLDLSSDEVGAHPSTPGHERVPRTRVRGRERASRHVIAGGTPLDHVGGQGKGGTAEADERGGPQLAHRRRDAVAHGLGTLGTVSRAPGGIGPGALAVAMAQQLVDALARAIGVVEDRADTRLNLDAHTGQAQGDHDVRKEDARVHAVAPHGLHRCLGGHVGAQAGLEHGQAHVGAQLAILRQGASGLTHEPHGGGPVSPSQGAQQRGRRHVSPLI